MAFYIGPVLTLRDPAAGEKAFASLEVDPTIEGAWLFDRNKQLVAKWGSATDGPFATACSDRSNIADSGSRTAGQGIGGSARHCGGPGHRHVISAGQYADLEAQLAEFAQIGRCHAGFAMFIAVGLSWRLQRSISLPIIALTGATQHVAQQADYSIRVESNARAELKTLQDAFNGMLEHIQSSDRALQQAHDELEERVFARTAELMQEVARRTSIQEALERAKEAAEAANLAKSEFLANMSHEIRTPLNGILGFTDLLLSAEDECTTEDRREYLQTIHRSGHHLLELISDVLDISKIEAGRLEVERIPCSPHQIIADVVSVLRVRARKGLRLELQCRTRLPDTVQSDPARLRQLLMNLIGNAIKFTEQGDIRIDRRHDRRAACRCCSSMS